MDKYDVVSGRVQLVRFERAGRVWAGLRAVDSRYANGFFSAKDQARPIAHLLRELTKALSSPPPGRSTLPLVGVAKRVGWEFWGINLPAPIADYIRSGDFERDVHDAPLLPTPHN